MAYLPKTFRAGNNEFDIKITKRPRSRKMSMRFHAIRREITINVPARTSNRTILTFITRHQSDMTAHIDSLLAPITLCHGTRIPVMGVEHMISPHKGETNGIPHFVVMSPPDKVAANTRKQLENLLRNRTETVIQQLFQSDDFKAQPHPTRISLRDTASRWGSCGTNGHIMLSWRLAFAPIHVMDYVIIHECCHLIHHNHSKDFWALCNRHCNDMKQSMAWLREHGTDLFRYR